uniref:FABP domain-containing protein n=1 Tax=Steinernema glaseri TaxID=37863 RepID=A0A1I8AM12_9BILA
MAEPVVPSSFFGAFKLERSENFDEYLASKGVGFLLRKIIGFSSVTKAFSQGDESNRYNMENRTSKKNLVHKNWALGETFEDEGLDGKRHKITFGITDSGVLTENHIRLELPNDPGETYQYSIDGDYLVLKMENQSVSCRRFFKRLPSEAN